MIYTTDGKKNRIIIILGESLTGTSGDLREMSHLFQRLSVIVQHFNSVLIHDSFVSELHID